MSASLVTFVIGENPPPRLDKALARDVPEAAALSRSRLAKLIGEWSCIQRRARRGRTHQIRVHMAHCGHALIGDPVYGGRRKLSPKAVGEAGVAAVADFRRQALHAATLGFVHPVTEEEMQFEAAMPDDMRDLLRALGGQG